MLQPIAISTLILLPLAAFAQTQDQDPVKPKEVAPTVIEAETEIPFPIWMDLEVLDGERHHLCGTGVREKTIFRVDVYGFAYYLERKAAIPILREAVGKLTLKKAFKDKKFHKAFLSDKFNKSLRWVFARDVDGEDIAEAFDEFLSPGIRRIAPDEKTLKKGLAAMRVMRGYFETTDIEEGDELIFVWETGGKMHTFLNGRKLGTIENVHLCYSMFDVFLGEDPVDAGGKRNIIEGLYTYLFPDR